MIAELTFVAGAGSFAAETDRNIEHYQLNLSQHIHGPKLNPYQ